jgi:hypothetical protein
LTCNANVSKCKRWSTVVVNDRIDHQPAHSEADQACSYLLDWVFLDLATIVLEVHHNFLQAIFNVKSLDSSWGVHINLVFPSCFNEASVSHVVHQLGSTFIVESTVLSCLDSRSQVCQLLHICLEFLLLQHLILLLIFYLVLGPSSL